METSPIAVPSVTNASCQKAAICGSLITVANNRPRDSSASRPSVRCATRFIHAMRPAAFMVTSPMQRPSSAWPSKFGSSGEGLTCSSR